MQNRSLHANRRQMLFRKATFSHHFQFHFLAQKAGKKVELHSNVNTNGEEKSPKEEGSADINCFWE